MAYFAVISDKPSNLQVIRCHINIWALRELAGMTFFCDIGLGLRAKSGDEIKNFRLALPFRSGTPEDLKDKLLTEKTARLILGQPVQINSGVISYDETQEQRTLKIKPVGPSTTDGQNGKNHFEGKNESQVVPKKIHLKTISVPTPNLTLDPMSTNDYSLWNLKLESPIEPRDSDSETYVRMRFPVLSFSRTWVNQDSGAIVDIRISDVREGLAANWEALEPNIVDIESLNLFVIAPSTMKMRSASPALKYVRLLEGPTWEAYLDRKLRKNKQVIYYWRSEKPITSNKPFMAFLDLAEEFIFSYFQLALLNAFMLAAAFGLYRYFSIESVLHFEYKHWILLLGGGLVVVWRIWKEIPSIIATLKKIWMFVRSLPRQLNNAIYSKKSE